MPPYLVWVWDAFWDLCTERPVGMGSGAIPYRAIKQWADDHEVAPTEVFVRWIRRMDTRFLNLMQSGRETSEADPREQNLKKSIEMLKDTNTGAD